MMGAGIALFCAAAFALGFGAWRGLHLLRHGSGDMGGFMSTTFDAGAVLAGLGGAILFGLLGVAAVFKGETAWILKGRFFHSYRFGPFRYVLEYDLAKIRQVRAAIPPGANQDHSVYFDYGGTEIRLGSNMLRRDADETMFAIIVAADKARSAVGTSVFDPVPAKPTTYPRPTAPPPNLVSALALVAANFVPMAGVVFLGWKLDELIILFWAESAVIGFYHLLKMAKLGGPLVLVFGPLFISHFGVFMAMHFYFIYQIFLGGMKATGPEPRTVETVLRILVPLWPAMLAYFISHGLSFWINFLGRREYEGRDLKTYMGAPYRRITIMHLAIIGGFWMAVLMGSAAGWLVALVLLKTGFDLHAHVRERARAIRPPVASLMDSAARFRTS